MSIPFKLNHCTTSEMGPETDIFFIKNKYSAKRGSLPRGLDNVFYDSRLLNPDSVRNGLKNDIIKDQNSKVQLAFH